MPYITATNTDFAFIVPYRKRIAHLRMFVPHIAKRFKRASICLVEQADEKPFNRGALLNIGYKLFGYQFPYAAYHDIDMLPTIADYSYPHYPTHIATKVQQFNFQLPFETYFGGVVLFNRENFEKIGGYSNNFWGWGGEDDELYNRIAALGMRIERRSCRFESIYHARAYAGPFDPDKMIQAKEPRKPDDTFKNTQYEHIHTDLDFFGCLKIAVLL